MEQPGDALARARGHPLRPRRRQQQRPSAPRRARRGPQAAHRRARAGCRDALRRAARALALLVPRRRLEPRGAGQRGQGARPRGARARRPRWALRRGAVRRGCRGGRAADGVRHRVHARSRGAAERHPRPRRQPPGGARDRSGRLHGTRDRPHRRLPDHRRARRARREGQARVRARAARRDGRRRVARALRLPQGRRAAGARAARIGGAGGGCGGPRARPAHVALRPGPRRGRAERHRRPPRLRAQPACSPTSPSTAGCR